MAATAVANAAKSRPPSIPPASPFAELLRRSKFATYDPAIRQSYSAPPANAHRGDWGLKRPISLRRKGAFISLSTFEHPAHFSEWNNAENEVRFIRRVGEMGVTPDTDMSTPWYKSLGKAKTDPLFDSDFCPGENTAVKLEEEKKDHINLDTDVGGKGPGAYGPDRPLAQDTSEVHLTLNVNAMTKKEFKRYIRSLRALRPKFQEYINANAKKIGTDNLYALSQRNNNQHHRGFLQEQMWHDYQDLSAKKIEPQPHPNAALMYAHPTPSESLLWTKPQPGIILNKHKDASGFRYHENALVASFGGITALMDKQSATLKTPLLEVYSEEGVSNDPDRQNKSFANMRVFPRDGISLKFVPKVVGRQPEGLNAAKLTAQVVLDHGVADHALSNPYPIGSRQYITNQPLVDMLIPQSHLPSPITSTVEKLSNEKLLSTLGGIVTDQTSEEL